MNTDKCPEKYYSQTFFDLEKIKESLDKYCSMLFHIVTAVRIQFLQ